MGFIVIQLYSQQKGKEKNMAENKVIKTGASEKGAPTKNEVATTTSTLSKGEQYKVSIVQELENSFAGMGEQLEGYRKTCVINAIGSLVLYCQNNAIKLEDINPIVLKTSLQNVAFTKLNMAGLPSEAYFDIRPVKVEIEKDGKKLTVERYNVVVKPQGCGNEKLTREFGVDIDTLCKCWEVHEGDEFTMPQYEGTSITPPTFKPHFENMHKKVILVCYPVRKTDGTEEYLIATRESIKPNIIAQIRQNAMYKFKVETEYTNKAGEVKKYSKVDTEARDKFYAKLNKEAETMTVEQLIDTYADYINPTYTSGGSREAMILRKMKNNALKNYPKEYDNEKIKSSVENMFEEDDPSIKEQPKVLKEEPVDVVTKVENEIEEEQVVENAPQDFDVVDENGEVVTPSVEEDIVNDPEKAPF